MTSGFDTHVETTRGVATSTSGAAGPLGAMADSMPESPDAGKATGAVISFMQSLAGTMSDLTAALEHVGEQVSQSMDTYERDDGDSASTVSGVDIPSGPAR